MVRIKFIVSIFVVLTATKGCERYENPEFTEETNMLISGMISQGAINIGYAKYHCHRLFLKDSCQSDPQLYFFWMKEGKTYIKQFKDCYEYGTLEITDVNLVSNIYENIQTFTNESFKPYQYLLIKENDTTIYTPWLDHYCFWAVSLIHGDSTIERRLSTLGMNADNNINRDYNKNTVTAKFITELEDILEQLNKGNHFRKVKKASPLRSHQIFLN